jgi:hypothetical protein
MSAPCKTTLLVPTRHCDFKAPGRELKRHTNEPGTIFVRETVFFFGGSVVVVVVDVVVGGKVVDVVVVEDVVDVGKVVVVVVVVLVVVVVVVVVDDAVGTNLTGRYSSSARNWSSSRIEYGTAAALGLDACAAVVKPSDPNVIALAAIRQGTEALSFIVQVYWRKACSRSQFHKLRRISPARDLPAARTRHRGAGSRPFGDGACHERDE